MRPLLFTFLISLRFFPDPCAQSNEYRWESKGELPKVIEESIRKFPSFTNFPMSHYSNLYAQSTKSTFERLLSSGRVLYGHTLVTKLNAALEPLLRNNLFKNDSQFYVLKSKVSAVIHFQNTFLVTTGLISQCTHIEQLYYLLLRELEKENYTKASEKEVYTNLNNFDDLIKNLYFQSEVYESEIDQLALKKHINAGYKPEQAAMALDVLNYSELPFEEINVRDNYFGTTMFVPNSIYEENNFVDFKISENLQKQKSIALAFERRKNALMKLDPIAQKANKDASDVFIEFRNLARLQMIEEYVLSGYHEYALYSIAIMEKESIDAGEYLGILKAKAWCGLVAEEFIFDINRFDKSHYLNAQTESGKFFKMFNKLNSYAIATFALRITTDLMNTAPTLSIKVKMVRDEIVKILGENNRFPIEKFSSDKIQVPSLQEKSSNLDTLTKYDQINELKSKNLVNLNGNDFFYFGIPDLVSDSQFLANFKRPKKNTIRDDISLTIDFTLYNKKGINHKKSEKNELDFIANQPYLNSKTKFNIKLITAQKSMTTEEYNVASQINQHLLQKHNIGGSWDYIPVLYNPEIDSKEQPSLVCSQFVNKYKPKIRGVHFVALTVVAIPWVISDLILRGNQSTFLYFTYNQNTGRIENFDQTNFSYSWTKASSIGQFIQRTSTLLNDEKK